MAKQHLSVAMPYADAPAEVEGAHDDKAALEHTQRHTSVSGFVAR